MADAHAVKVVDRYAGRALTMVRKEEDARRLRAVLTGGQARVGATWTDPVDKHALATAKERRAEGERGHYH